MERLKYETVLLKLKHSGGMAMFNLFSQVCIFLLFVNVAQRHEETYQIVRGNLTEQSGQKGPWNIIWPESLSSCRITPDHSRYLFPKPAGKDCTHCIQIPAQHRKNHMHNLQCCFLITNYFLMEHCCNLHFLSGLQDRQPK